MPAARKRVTLTPARRLAREKAIIKDLKTGKLSYRQIAAKHKVSLPTVNAKARKAGISRARVKKTSTVARKPKTAARKTRMTTRKTRTTTRRTTSATRRPTARKKVAHRKVTRKTTRTRTTTARTIARAEHFTNQFRELVMSYYPNMPLRTYERLHRTISKALQ